MLIHCLTLLLISINIVLSGLYFPYIARCTGLAAGNYEKIRKKLFIRGHTCAGTGLFLSSSRKCKGEVIILM
jgi:hypothetical protein